MRVEARAQARLHFGFLDPTGGSGRRFGGFGMALDRPRAVLHLEPAGRLEVEGEDRERVARVAARLHEVIGRPPRARIRVAETIPAHVGLGSGTQIALALAAGLDRLYDLRRPPDEWGALAGRGRRSGVGCHLFRHGGFVLDGGHAADGAPAGPPPLVVRRAFPPDWRIVLTIPAAPQALSGDAEEDAFRRLGPAPPAVVDRIARLVVLSLLPALAEEDLAAFGAALARIQDDVGACFAPAQEGPFHPAAAGVVRALRDAGACGVGQSSWGPAVYAFAADAAEERRLVGIARAAVPGAAVIAARAANRGAAVEPVPE